MYKKLNKTKQAFCEIKCGMSSKWSTNFQKKEKKKVSNFKFTKINRNQQKQLT